MALEGTDYILEMRSVSKTFPGVKALSDVDFCVRKGTVHALVGENGAGKSTLMKIISGLYQPDEGAVVVFASKKVENLTPLKAIEMGISTIHQELSPILDMTIAENIFLGQEETRYGLVQIKKLEQRAAELLQQVGMDCAPSSKMRDLTVAQMQMVEITKSIFKNASLIIMDEPTSSLMSAEIKLLFQQIEMLKSKGVAIIYISHKMDEIFKLADDITVLRDGTLVSTGPASDYTMEKLITQMVGRNIDNIYPKQEAEIGEVVFEVKNLSRSGKFEDINFQVRKGEILGFTGLVGAGRTEVMRAIFGLDPYDSGEFFVNGKPISIKRPIDAMKNGIAMVSEDRKQWGLVLCRSVKENIALPNLNRFKSGGLLNKKKEQDKVRQFIGQLNVKTPSMETPISSLSGGNQQKVVLAKWLMHEVKILILDEPTRGIDVAAKNEIYNMIGDLVKQGMAVIVISSELPEVMGISDRIMVMSNGQITHESKRSEFAQEKLLKESLRNL